MKTQRKLLIANLIAALTFLFGIWCRADTYDIAVSPFFTQAEQRDVVFRNVMLFVLEMMSTNDTVVIYDGYNIQEIARVRIPSDKVFASEGRARARALRLRVELAEIKAFLITNQPCPPKMSGCVNLPRFLSLVGNQPHSASEKHKIVVLGSGVYMSTSEPGFNCDQAWPSDRHLVVTEKLSPWGAANRSNLLAGITVYYGYALPNSFANELHFAMMSRFLSLFCKCLGGTLCTFSPDVRMTLENAVKGASTPVVTAEINSDDSALVMHTVITREIPSLLAKADKPTLALNSTQTPPATSKQVLAALIASNTPLVALVTVTNPLSSNYRKNEAQALAPEFGTMRIELYWESKKCDFDLWVKPTPNSPDLYYGNTAGPEGFFSNDCQAGGGSEEEIVIITKPVDARQVRCWLNLFAGKVKHPECTVKVYYKGKSYQKSFTFKSVRGNRGAESTTKTGDGWMSVPIVSMIGLQYQ